MQTKLRQYIELSMYLLTPLSQYIIVKVLSNINISICKSLTILILLIPSWTLTLNNDIISDL